MRGFEFAEVLIDGGACVGEICFGVCLTGFGLLAIGRLRAMAGFSVFTLAVDEVQIFESDGEFDAEIATLVQRVCRNS